MVKEKNTKVGKKIIPFKFFKFKIFLELTS